MRISDWSADVCSSDLVRPIINLAGEHDFNEVVFDDVFIPDEMVIGTVGHGWQQVANELVYERSGPDRWTSTYHLLAGMVDKLHAHPTEARRSAIARLVVRRSEEHTSELQSLMRISYAVFCFKKKTNK